MLNCGQGKPPGTQGAKAKARVPVSFGLEAEKQQVLHSLPMP